MLNATNAAHSLNTLASPPAEKQDTSLSTPPRRNVSIQNMEYERPDHTRHVSIKCKGTKRLQTSMVEPGPRPIRCE
eukprot:5587914-Prymnesium_polylepis.2